MTRLAAIRIITIHDKVPGYRSVCAECNKRRFTRQVTYRGSLNMILAAWFCDGCIRNYELRLVGQS